MEFYNQLSLLKTGHRLRRRADDRQSDVRPRNPDARVRLRSRRRPALAPRRLRRHPQRRRHEDLEPANRPGAAGTLFRSSTSRRESGPANEQLQEEFGLPVRDDVPLLAIVSRLTDQKGLDLVMQGSETLLPSATCSCACSGSGEAKYQDWLRRTVQTRAGESGRSHRIRRGAGSSHRGGGRHVSDAEPVRAVRPQPDVQPDLRDRSASSGPSADWPTRSSTPRPTTWRTARRPGSRSPTTRPPILSHTIERALTLFADKPEWLRLVRSGMNQDWSWRRSALQYVRVYEKAVAKRCAALAAPAVAAT